MSSGCIIGDMSETTTSTEPVTGPIEPAPPAPPVGPPPYVVAEVPPHNHPVSRLNKVLTWVGIVAGSVFIVAVIFGTGFRLGLAVGSHGGGMGHHRQHDSGQMEDRGGPPHFPGGGGPMWRPAGPGFPFPNGPGFFPGFPGGPGEPGPGANGGQGGARWSGRRPGPDTSWSLTDCPSSRLVIEGPRAPHAALLSFSTYAWSRSGGTNYSRCVRPSPGGRTTTRR